MFELKLSVVLSSILVIILRMSMHLKLFRYSFKSNNCLLFLKVPIMLLRILKALDF